MQRFRGRFIGLMFAVAAAALAGCGSNGSVAGAADGGGGSDSGDAAARDSGDAALGGDGGLVTGSGTITGEVHGASFTNAAASYVLGAPDDSATTVVYLFSKTVACDELAAPGWDSRIANGTQFVELKMFGTTPAIYTVVTTLTPAPGEASVNYTLSSTTGTPAEQSGAGGTVTLTAQTANASASGSFALLFGASHLDGTFNASFCAGGHEP